jgi:surfeit locus 1 family protein
MSSTRQLLSPRWVAGHLLALTLVMLFVNFGFWQLRRHDERQAYNALVGARLVAEPQPYGELRERFSLEAPAADEASIAYRRAEATGRFDVEREVLLRSRALDGQPGYHVLTPLRLEDGGALLVDRGWVPFELDTPPIAEAAPPAGTVTVSGILLPRQTQPSGLGAKDPPTGELDAVFWVDTERLSQDLPYRLEPVYLELTAQTPAQATPLPRPLPPPELGGGPHLSYALQWFSFALIGIVGYGFLLRSVLREGRAAGAGGGEAEVENSQRGKAAGQ